ncbi:hypothetical protein ZHAS_00006553 [Anopheles sinensis]|uniref:Uncharacterized protein n=1 Tax=Anopheles sinensis TaxID=74873 RepID=A0A084VML8_ANOSI|nr:hypothetical protein ZHAS_00006553 [Anopheles sinensis]
MNHPTRTYATGAVCLWCLSVDGNYFRACNKSFPLPFLTRGLHYFTFHDDDDGAQQIVGKLGTNFWYGDLFGGSFPRAQRWPTLYGVTYVSNIFITEKFIFSYMPPQVWFSSVLGKDPSSSCSSEGSVPKSQSTRRFTPEARTRTSLSQSPV